MNVFSDNCLAGGTYLVTGASSGIGKETALKISQCGGKVILSGRNEVRLKETFASLASGVTHATYVQSLSNADETSDWLKEIIKSHGPFSGVFHAAGIELIRPVRLINQTQLNEILGSSLFAAFGISREVSKKNAMIEGGSIVFMSSVAGTTGEIGQTAYSAAKSAINGLVRSLACEVSPKRIRVNSIVAGAVESEMLKRLADTSGQDMITNFEKNHLLGFGKVSDIANAAIFLMSDAGSWITGSNLVIDGGFSVR